MSDNLVYMFGKLGKAIEILITNHGDVRNRVWIAAQYIFMIQPGGLPESLREDVEWIHKAMTRYPANELYRTELEATFHRTRNVTASKIAARIWMLYHLMETEIEARKQRG